MTYAVPARLTTKPNRCLVARLSQAFRAQTMKLKLLLLILFFVPVATCGGSVAATQELHPDLIPIYEKLISDTPCQQLVGTPLDLTLKLKHASEKYLLFHDTRIIVDEATKYYLVQWKFNAHALEAIIGKADVACRVKGRITEVVKGSTTPGMPYIVVELSSVEL